MAEKTNKQKIRENFKRIPRGETDLLRLYDEPTYLGFKLLFHFNDQMSPLLNLSDDVEHSARTYLLNNGYTEEAYYLENFINTLKYVSQQSQWYFQSLENLKDVWDFDVYNTNNLYNKNIVINTLESLDLRITKILDYYTKACYSYTSKRVIIPENLRKFSMSIYVTDIRDFQNNIHDYDDSVVEIKSTEKGSWEDLRGVDTLYSRASLFFKINNCEISNTSRSHILETLTNTNDVAQSTNKIQINFNGPIEEYSNYILNEHITVDPDNTTQIKLDSRKPQNFLQDTQNKITERYKTEINGVNKYTDLNQPKSEKRTIDQLKQEAATSIKDKLIKTGEGLAQRGVLNTIDSVENLILNNVNKVVLGNIYGNGVRDVRNILNGSIL